MGYFHEDEDWQANEQSGNGTILAVIGGVFFSTVCVIVGGIKLAIWICRHL